MTEATQWGYFVVLLAFLGIVVFLVKNTGKSKRTREYYKQIKESSGLLKTMLVVSNDDYLFITSMPQSLWLELRPTYQGVVSQYYMSSFDVMGDQEDLDLIGEEIISNKENERKLASRFFVVAFVIVLCRIANDNEGIVDDKKLDEYLKSKTWYDDRKNISLIAQCTLNYLYDPLISLGAAYVSKDTEKLASMLFAGRVDGTKAYNMCIGTSIRKAFSDIEDSLLGSKAFEECSKLKLITTNKDEIIRISERINNRLHKNCHNEKSTSKKAKNKAS